MNTETGALIPASMLPELSEEQRSKYIAAPFATDQQVKRGKVGRNEKCPCGSGVKFKKCHLMPK